MRARIFLALLFASALCGCDFRSWFESFLPKEEIAYGKDFFAKLRAHDFEAVEQPLDPSVHDPKTRQKLEQLASVFPQEEPTDIAVVGSNVFTDLKTNTVTYNLTYQYEYPQQWVLANVFLERRDDKLIVKGVHAERLAESLQHANRFTFQNKDAARYAILGWTILVPVFIVASLIACIRTTVPRRKWLWIIFILLGFGQLSVNWTTGAVGFQLVSFQVLGAGVFWAGPYAPLILSGSIPVGAALFWIRRRRWREMNAAKAAEVFG